MPSEELTDPGLDEIFKEFRKGFELQLGAEDYDTLYNLGVAYKEMGLLNEAIWAFQFTAKDEVRALECCSMLGLCFMEKGMPNIAIQWFLKGLDIPGRRKEQYLAIRYDLARAYDADGQKDRALKIYKALGSKRNDDDDPDGHGGAAPALEPRRPSTDGGSRVAAHKPDDD